MEAIARVVRVQSFLDSYGQMVWVSVSMGAKDPTSSRDLGTLEGAEGDVSPKAVELGLAVGDK